MDSSAIETVILYEFAPFGLNRMIEACRSRGLTPLLLTDQPSRYPLSQSQGAVIVQVNTHDPQAVIALIDERYDRTSIRALVNATDTWCQAAVRVAQHLGLPTNSKRTFELARNKHLLRDHCRNEGIRSVAAARITTYAEAAAFLSKLQKPIIIKDASGTGSQNVYRFQTLAELARHATLFQDQRVWVAEEFIDGVLYSAEVVSFRGSHQLLGVTSRTLSREPHFQELSLSFPMLLPQSVLMRIQAYVYSLLDSVGYEYGFSHTELMLVRNEPVLIELNPRMGGIYIGEMMSRALGCNVYDKMLLASIGQPPFFASIDYRCGAAAICLHAEVPGQIVEVHGTERAGCFPGSFYHPVRVSGDLVHLTGDYTSRYGIVFAEDENSYMAYLKAMAISTAISVEMAERAQSPTL